MTPEAKVKAKIKQYLNAIGAWHCCPIGSAFGKSGVPDFIACYQGRLYGIEAKAPGKLRNTTTHQDREITAIQAAGGVALVVDDVSQLKPIFEGT